MRFKMDARHVCDICPRFPPAGEYVWIDGLHLLLSIAPTGVLPELISWVDLFKRWGVNLCSHDLRDLCKMQGTLVKQAGKYFSANWHWYVYWELLGCYRAYKPLEEFLPEVETWLGRKHANGGVYGLEYYTMLFDSILNTLHDNFRRPEEVIPLNEYVKRGSWMRGKAGTGGKCTYFDKSTNKWGRSRAYRGVESVLLQDSDILSKLQAVSHDEIHIQQKAEGSKVRPVAKAGNELTRQMDFVSTWLDTGLYGSSFSTLFLSASQAEELDLAFVADSQDPKLLKVPLDQSNFDQHKSYVAIMTCVLAMRAFLIEKKAPDDIIAVMDNILCTLDRHDVTIHVAGKKLPFVWNNGLPSGWRWTALLGTLLNVGEFKTICLLIQREKFRAVRYHRLVGQGDDLTFCTYDLDTVHWIVEKYNQVGLEVNPQKVYISRYRSEFLRRSIESNGIFGYIPRTLMAIRFRNPVLCPSVLRITRGYAKFNLWHMAILRGADTKKVISYLKDDVEQIPLDFREFSAYLLTPNSFGGGGVAPNTRIAHFLSKYSDGLWRAPKIEYEKKDFSLNLGGWEPRVAPWRSLLGREGLQDLQNTLVSNWGLPESKRVGKVFESFAIVPKVGPLPIHTIFGRLESTPKPWKELGIARYLSDIVKKKCLEKDKVELAMTPEGAATYKIIKSRSSKTIADIWATGYWEIPGPTLDHVGVKYGQRLKDKYRNIVARIFLVRNLNKTKLQQYLYSVELDLYSDILGNFKIPMSL